MNSEYPDFFARFYDLIYHRLRDDADSQFFLNETAKTKGRILEIGVGTGRLVITPFRVIMHIADKNEQIMAINNVFDHLNSNGRFIFDTFVPDLNHLMNGMENVVDFQGEYEPGKMVKRIVSTKPDLVNQVIDVNFRFEWDENDHVRQQEWSTPMRFFFRYELEHLIERSKFTNYKIFGDYQGNELNRQSKEFVVVCLKQPVPSDFLTV